MTTTEIDELMQLIRTLKTSQFRKQLEYDAKHPQNYMDEQSGVWLSRLRIVNNFFMSAKEQ
jgi:hypothetical protein